MATLYDLLPDSTKAAYPLDTLTPKWQQRLATQVPPDYPAQYAQTLSSALAERAPRMTVVHEKVRAVQRAMSGQAPPVAGPDVPGASSPSSLQAPNPAFDAYNKAPAWQRVGMRMANTWGRTVAGVGDLVVNAARSTAGGGLGNAAEMNANPNPVSRNVAPIVPPARTFAEHATDVGAGLAPYVLGAEAAPAKALTTMSAIAAAEPGTPTQRIVRGATTALAGKLTGAISGGIEGANPGLLRAAAASIPTAAVFGGAQPWAAEKISGALGSPTTPVTWDDARRGFLEQLLINSALGLAHAPGLAAAGEANRLAGEHASRQAQFTETARRGVVPPQEAARLASMGQPTTLGEKPQLKPEVQVLADAAKPPEGMAGKDLERAQELTQSLNNTVAGRLFTLKDPDTGKPLVAKIHTVYAYPHDDPNGPPHVRVIAEDSNGHLAPLNYPTLESFTNSVVAPYEPPVAEKPQAPAPTKGAFRSIAIRVSGKVYEATPSEIHGSLLQRVYAENPEIGREHPGVPWYDVPFERGFVAKDGSFHTKEEIEGAHGGRAEGLAFKASGVVSAPMTDEQRAAHEAEQRPGKAAAAPAPEKPAAAVEEPIRAKAPPFPETQVPEQPRPPLPKPEELPSTYQSSSRGGEIAINRMAGDHLQNAHAIEPEGPVKQALAAEIARRGLKPKPAKPPRVREPMPPEPPRNLEKEAEQRRIGSQDLFSEKKGEGAPPEQTGTRGRAQKPEAPPPPTEEAPRPKVTNQSPPTDLFRQHVRDAGDGELNSMRLKGAREGWHPDRLAEVENEIARRRAGEPKAEAPKAPEAPKRTGEPSHEDIQAALEKHYPGELDKLVNEGATDEQLDALVHAALHEDGWDVGGHDDNVALLKAVQGMARAGKPPNSREEMRKRLEKRFPDAPPFIIDKFIESHFAPKEEKINRFEPGAEHTQGDQPVFSADEARAVLHYHGKTAEEAMREVEQNGTPAEKLVARRTRESLTEQNVEKNKIHLVHKDMKPAELSAMLPPAIATPQVVGDLRAMARDNATLGAHISSPGLIGRHEEPVFLNGNFARARGVGRRVVIHEELHQALSSIINWGLKELRNPKSTLGGSNRERQIISAVADLERLYLHVLQETLKRSAAKTLGAETERFLQQSNFLFEPHVPDGGIHEIMTWGLTDHRAQNYLESIQYRTHRNGLTAFVDIMRRLLGMKPGESTALSELLRISDELLERSAPADASEPGLTTISYAKQGGPRFVSDELRARLGVKKKLPQEELEGLGERTPKPLKMGTPEAKSAQDFHDAFWEKVRDPMNRNTSPITLAEEAAKESGAKVPDGFDPNTEVARVRAKALAEAGQGDAFAAAGVEIPKPKKAEDKPAVAKDMATDAAAQAVQDAGGEHLAPPQMRTVKASDLSILPEFQKREGVTQGDLINPRVISQHLEPSPKNPQGGYNQALMDQSPVTIWTDKTGAFGEAGKTYILDGHHRRYLASNTFGKRGEDYVRTGSADRSMNAVEVFVTPEQAQQIAEYANRRTARTSYIEDARLASRLSDEGKSVKEIASALGTKQSEAERAANIGRLDPAVREFFADEAMRTHGGHLGAAVSAHPDYFNSVRQRMAMRAINDGQYGSAVEFAAALKQERGLLDRLNQLDMGNDFGNAGFTPQQVKDATNRGLRYVESIKTALSRQLAALKAIEKSGGDAEAVKKLSEKVSADRERAKALEKSLNPHELFDRIAKGLRLGVPAEKTLQNIKDEIDLKLGPESPVDNIPAGTEPQIMHSYQGFTDDEKRLAETALPQLWRDVLKGQPGVMRASIRRIPRGDRLKTVDAQGRVVQRYEGKSLYEPDYYSESALVRLMAHAKLLGGNFVLPRDNAIDLKAGYSEEALHMHRWNWRRMELIGDKAARLMGPFTDNSKLVSRVLSGRAKVEDLPKDLQHVPDAIRNLTSEIFDYVNKVRKSMGMEPIKPLKGYDLPHMITGKASELVDSLLQSFLGGVDVKQRQAALEDMRNRFFEHRNNHDRWTEDAALQLDAYISVMSRYSALAPVLRRLGSDIAHMENEDPIRAGLVADWLKATLLRRKTKVDNILDNTSRALFYAKNEPQASSISPRRAAEMLFPNEDTRKMGARLGTEYKRFFLVPEGVNFEVSPGRDQDLLGRPRKGAEVLLTDKFGRKLIGTQGEMVFTGLESPKLRKPFELAGKAGVEIGHGARELTQALSGGKLQTRPEGLTGKQAKEVAYRAWRQDIEDSARSPGSAWFRQMGGNQMRAVLGWNFRAMIANWFQPYITSAPEYGILPVLHASARVGGGEVMRRIVDLAEKRGYITPENAASYREIFQDTKQRAMQLGSLQGEVMSAREQLLHPTLEPYQKIAEVVGPMYGYRLIEDFTRGVNVLGSEVLARRYGLDPAVAWQFHKELGAPFFEDWAKTVAAMRTKGTAERLQSILDSETMFDYNALGQAPIFGGTAGKLLGRLMTFPANFFPRYVTRPVGGALKVGAAVARGATSALTGGKYGEVAPRPERAVSRLHALPTEDKYLVRGEYPAPVNGAERWLDKYGARFHDRQAMRVFMTQAVTVGLMHALTEATGINAMLPGTPGWDVMVTLLAYSLDPHNKKLAKALERARSAAVVSPERGVETGMSPAVRLMWQYLGPENTTATWARAQKRAKQGRPMQAAGELARPVGDALSEFLREQVPGLVAFRRSIQNSVEMGPVPSAAKIARTAVPDVVGTRSYVQNRDAVQMVKGNLGLTPTDEEAKRRKIIKGAK
jgi:hypothetical protein